MRNPQSDAEQVEVEKKFKEDWIRTSYDTLFGYLQSIADVYARAIMVRHLDKLYENALASLSEDQSQSAETVDVRSTSASGPGAASTASSTPLSGESAGKTSRDPSFSESDLTESGGSHR